MNLTDKILLTVLFLLGALTLMLSGSVIFDLFGMREMEGNYVEFIVWANFISSILYIYTAVDFIRKRQWNWYYLAVSFIILVVASLGFWFYIENGGIHEPKTINAIIFRIIFTGILLISSYIKYKKGLKK
ncbi:MAG: hypothetical protein CVV25_10855 [Ignavibacteriae bacterium HGW-Ignavibacteriae-4]|jgi:hypothetical protein|nr:MAG: hypothetical protein CVV25_10855 [Ignavibacteriae bacterium HGW-Ignavibacteriae-4]